MKNKYIAFGLLVVLVLVFWNLLGLLYSSVITRSGYRFGAGADLFIPLVVAVVMGYLLFLRKREK